MKKKNTNIFEYPSGKIGGLIFQKNGRVRIDAAQLIKRKKNRKNDKKN